MPEGYIATFQTGILLLDAVETLAHVFKTVFDHHTQRVILLAQNGQVLGSQRDNFLTRDAAPQVQIG